MNPKPPTPTQPQSDPTPSATPAQPNLCTHKKTMALSSPVGLRVRLEEETPVRGRVARGRLGSTGHGNEPKTKKKNCRTPTTHAPLVVFRISGPAPLAVAAEYPTVSLTKATPGVQRTGGGVGGGGAGREGKAQPAVQAGKRDTTKKNSARFRLRLEGLQSAAHQRVEHKINIPVSTVEISESSRCQDAAAAVPTHARTSTAADRMTFYGQPQLRCTKVPYHTSQLHGAWFIFPLLLQLCKLV